MIRVGIAGVGFMGMVHYLTYQKLRGVRVEAICDIKQKRLTGDWKDIQGNFGPAGKQMDASHLRTYTKLEDLLADPDLDSIEITLPPALHAETAIQAMRQGKHAFSEKPMSLNPADCQKMLRTAQQTGKRLFVGHVLPFFPEYAWALKIVQSGQYGKVLGGSFKRVISDPSWMAHFWSAKDVGGPMLDLHVHDAHFIRLMFGMPSAVMTHGRQKKSLAENWNSLFYFDKSDVAVHANSGTISQQGRAFNHGFEIHLEEATIAFEFAVIGGEGQYLCPPTIFDKQGKVKHPKLGSDDPMDAFVTELREVATCIKQDRDSEILNPVLARDAIVLCQKQSQSLVQKRLIKI